LAKALQPGRLALGILNLEFERRSATMPHAARYPAIAHFARPRGRVLDAWMEL